MKKIVINTVRYLLIVFLLLYVVSTVIDIFKIGVLDSRSIFSIALVAVAVLLGFILIPKEVRERKP